MLLDKLAFLEQAVKTACEEVIEEADALIEGADAKLSANVLKTIVNDLIQSIENWDTLQLEEEPKEEGEQETFELFPGERIFEPGERVRIKDRQKITPPHKNYLERVDGFTKFEFFRFWDASDGDEAVVLKVVHLPSSSRPLYVIKSNRKKFFIFQAGLEEI